MFHSSTSVRQHSSLCADLGSFTKSLTALARIQTPVRLNLLGACRPHFVKMKNLSRRPCNARPILLSLSPYIAAVSRTLTPASDATLSNSSTRQSSVFTNPIPAHPMPSTLALISVSPRRRSSTAEYSRESSSQTITSLRGSSLHERCDKVAHPMVVRGPRCVFSSPALWQPRLKVSNARADVVAS